MLRTPVSATHPGNFGMPPLLNPSEFLHDHPGIHAYPLHSGISIFRKPTLKSSGIQAALEVPTLESQRSSTGGVWILNATAQ
jgi:hypothetical protein